MRKSEKKFEIINANVLRDYLKKGDEERGIRWSRIRRKITLEGGESFYPGEDTILLENEQSLRGLSLAEGGWESLYAWFLAALKKCNFLIILGSMIIEVTPDDIKI